MKYKSITGYSNINRDKWDDLIKENIYASPFQTPDFYTFYNMAPGYSAEVFAIEENDKLNALCLVTFQKEKGFIGYFSRRAIIYGGPLISDAGKEALTQLLSVIKNNLKGKVIYLETRNLNDYSEYCNCFKEAGWRYEPFLNYQIVYSSIELVWANFNQNRKRQIKKAFKNGVELVEAKNIEEIEEYYFLLYDLYKNKIKKPLITFDFLKLFFETKIGKLFLVKWKEKIIGGIVCPILEGKTIYELYICGLDQEYKDLSPSVMATYAAIEYGLKNGLKKFDFMGAGKQNENYRVRDFKAKFGGNLVEYGRFIKICNPFLYLLGKSGLAILKKIKR